MQVTLAVCELSFKAGTDDRRRSRDRRTVDTALETERQCVDTSWISGCELFVNGVRLREQHEAPSREGLRQDVA